MRVVNTKDKRLSGNVLVNGKSIYVDVPSGTGFADVLKTMRGTIHKLASIGSFVYDGLEDAKQEVCILMLEGMLAYDQTKGAALSTFLYQYAYNKIVDKLRCHNKILAFIGDSCYYDNLEYRLELEQRTKHWSQECRQIMYRLFVDDELIKDVANDMQMTPWGLTRFVRRKLHEARNI